MDPDRVREGFLAVAEVEAGGPDNATQADLQPLGIHASI
jgi:hypothetical protein